MLVECIKEETKAILTCQADKILEKNISGYYAKQNKINVPPDFLSQTSMTLDIWSYGQTKNGSQQRLNQVCDWRQNTVNENLCQ